MLSSVQSTCIWFCSQNIPVVFSWHNCCEEVILPRCLRLVENTVLEMPGFALKAYFYSWVKAEREDCSCFLNVSMQIELEVQEECRGVTNLKCLLASYCFSNCKSRKWINSEFSTLATVNFLT